MSLSSQTWRCCQCLSEFAEHFPVCSTCRAEGMLLPHGKRPRAALDSMPAVRTARQLQRMSYRPVEHPGVYENLSIGAGALGLFSGPPSAGKSTGAMRLLNSVKGPVMYLASEEGHSPTLAARLTRCAVMRDDFFVVTHASVDFAVKFAVENKIVAACLDSVQESAWTAHELRHFLSVVPSLDLLLGVVQVVKDGRPAGAMGLFHEADFHVSVADMTWKLIKSRYQDISSVGGDVFPRQIEAA